MILYFLKRSNDEYNENKKRQAQSSGIRKTVNPPYGYAHTEDLLMSNLQTCWRQLSRDSRFSGARSIATLTKRSDANILSQAVLACRWRTKLHTTVQ